jgi:NADH-quinone oxidoreductase subunit L
LATTTFRFIGFEWNAITLASLLLFMGAMGKSAQFMLHTWLPDAMEGPTPVSALIHAATMVTAGVFMVARLSPVFEYSPTALTVVVIIGAITAFFAATVGLVQNDIKRVIAYSTCSQLGYMFVALGVGAYGAASSTCSPTPSSRRCCSWARARSSMPCTTSRTCGTWAACASTSRSRLRP